MADRKEDDILSEKDEPESEDETYEVVDLTEYARRHQWWSMMFGNNSGPLEDKYSIANHSGYVQVDWKKVEKDVNKAKKHLKKRTKQAAPEMNSFFEEVKATEFVKKNIVLFSGFVGGFLLGLAS